MFHVDLSREHESQELKIMNTLRKTLSRVLIVRHWGHNGGRKGKDAARGGLEKGRETGLLCAGDHAREMEKRGLETGGRSGSGGIENWAIWSEGWGGGGGPRAL